MCVFTPTNIYFKTVEFRAIFDHKDMKIKKSASESPFALQYLIQRRTVEFTLP